MLCKRFFTPALVLVSISYSTIVQAQVGPGAASILQPDYGVLASPASGQTWPAENPCSCGCSTVPNIVGDYLRENDLFFIADQGNGDASFGQIYVGNRRFKVARNNNALPQDRLSIDYSLNNGLGSVIPGAQFRRNQNEVILGAEKTFLNGWFSVDVRVPFRTTLATSSDFVGGALVDRFVEDDMELGNIWTILKVLLLRQDGWVVSSGVGFGVPTGRDDGVPVLLNAATLRVTNDAFYVQPFVAGSYTNSRFWVQGFAAVDIDTTGDRLELSDVEIAVLQHQTLVHLDLAAGWWLYRNSPSTVSGVAPFVELHFTGTTTSEDDQDDPRRITQFNLTSGLHLELGQRTTLSLAGSVPLLHEESLANVSQFLAQFNWRY